MKNKKTNKKAALLRAAGMGAVIILMGIIILLAGRVKREDINASSNSVYVKAKVTKVLDDSEDVEEYESGQNVEVEITSGKYKGQVCELANPNSYQRGAFCEEGTRIIALISENNGEIGGSVYNYDRSSGVWTLVIIFSIIMILVGGRKGILSLLSLVYTFVCIIFVMIPLVYCGFSAVPAAVLTSLLILAGAIYIINGYSDKSMCAIVGTCLGILIAGSLSMIIGKISNLDGYNMSEVESMVYIANHTELKISDILYAGILISSLGAVMDVSVSLAAAIKEVHDKKLDISFKELFHSGMHVGHDMMGTMSNTLILAYAGGAMCSIMNIYAYSMSYNQVMGQNSIIIEILSGLSGTIGVVLTVPIQALITSWWLCYQDKRFQNRID